MTENLYQALLRIRNLWDRWYDEKGNANTLFWNDFVSRQRDSKKSYVSHDRPGDVVKRLKERVELMVVRPSLWVDALCINQDNRSEQSSQVKMMEWIYRESTHLLIWLGKHFSTFDGREANLRHMLRSPWFERRWVVQEAVTQAGNSSILLPNSLLPCDELWSIAEKYRLSSRLSPIAPYRMWRHLEVSLGYELCPFADNNFKDSLMHNLDEYSDKKCSDPRDKVYSLLSISSDGSSFPVSYHWDVLVIFTRIAERYISDTRLGDILMQAAERNGNTDDAWPSWVPNWANARRDEGEISIVPFASARRTLMSLLDAQKRGERAIHGFPTSRYPRVEQCQHCWRDYVLYIEAWLLRDCLRTDGDLDCAELNEQRRCLFCQFQKGEPKAIVCILEKCKHAFLLSPSAKLNPTGPACYRLRGYMGFIVFWNEMQPYQLPVDRTTRLSSLLRSAAESEIVAIV